MFRVLTIAELSLSGSLLLDSLGGEVKQAQRHGDWWLPSTFEGMLIHNKDLISHRMEYWRHIKLPCQWWEKESSAPVQHSCWFLKASNLVAPQWTRRMFWCMWALSHFCVKRNFQKRDAQAWTVFGCWSGIMLSKVSCNAAVVVPTDTKSRSY